MADSLNERMVRAAIADQLRKLPWLEHPLRLTSEHGIRTASGVLQEVFAPQLAELAEAREALNRVREVVRQHRGEDTVPRRQLEAALYGDEEYRRG